MTTMWAQGDLVRVLQRTRLEQAATGRRGRRRAARPVRVAGSLRPVPAR